MLDIKTVIFSYIISNAICAIVIASLWADNRRRFAGLGFWLADFVMQFAALLLTAMRGNVPDFLSMTVSNTLVIGGTILLFAGLLQFVEKRDMQIRNMVLLAIFICVHAWFTLIHPSLEARNIIFSVGLLAICSQCAWLLLRQVDAEMYPITRNAGIVFSAYCFASIARIFVDVVVPNDENFFHSNVYDTSLIMMYQMLFIALTFSLFLMVNRRLVTNLELDLGERKQTEAALKLSEEKFFKAFHSSPDAILITRMKDGRLVEVNEGFSRLMEYSPQEALSSSSINLGLWANPQERDIFLADLKERHSIHNVEYDFRAKSGRILHCLYSGEIILLDGEAHVISVVRDITERKRVEDELRVLSRTVEQSQVSVIITDTNGAIEYVNPKFSEVTGYSLEEVRGKNPRILRSVGASPEMYKELWETILAGHEWRGEFQNQKKNGELFWDETVISPIVNEQGLITHFVSMKEDVTERKRAEETLLKLTAIEERQRLARELHDSVNQSIHSLVLFSETLLSVLEKNNVNRAGQIATRLQESARQALKETRLLLYEIQPSDPERSVNFIQDLETRLSTVERRAGVKAQIIQEGSLEYCPQEWYQNLFWITIEALNNALKHAQARSMQIIINCSPQYVDLEIVDDGKGFDTARVQSGGLGLRNMRERAALLGGKLTVDSTPGKGSRVQLRAEIK